MKKDNTENISKAKKSSSEHIGVVAHDPYLEPFEEAITGRYNHALWKIGQLTQNGKSTLSDFANGFDYFGLHKIANDGWVFREWAPNATNIYLLGDFNEWREIDEYRCTRLDLGTWELKLPAKAMKHGDLYKLHIKWNGGEGERIPAWAQRVVQDEATKIFSAQVWAPKQAYEWKKADFKPKNDPLFIYECHIGMAQDAEKVGTYIEFKDKVLPRIAKDGYNCIQVMAIQEHPYYGSFGYHVSSF
ncbi:MAG: 1,4-alpha-glucan-branching enzyme, partial [Prevotella sp.]